MPLQDEKNIIKDCINNCRIAQKKIYEQYSPIFFSICLRYVQNNHDAEQLLQDSFLKIFTQVGQYTFKGSFEGWMRRIVVNTCLDSFKTKGYVKDKNTDYFDTSLDLDTYVSINGGLENMSMNEILVHIQELSAVTRNVFNLYVFEGYNHKEIGELLGISVGTSQWHVNNARKILKEKIEKQSHKLLKKKHEASKVG